MKKTTFPQLIGKGLAHLQDGVDRLIAKGAEKLSDPQISKPKKGESKAKKLARSGAKAIGETLSTFYTEYEKLKSERKK